MPATNGEVSVRSFDLALRFGLRPGLSLALILCTRDQGRYGYEHDKNPRIINLLLCVVFVNDPIII